MGIPGLVTFCRRNNCYEEINLVTFAKEHKNLELLVDFYGIEQHIMELTLKSMAHRYRNEYLIIPGAEYDELICAFREFNTLFKNLGIKLVYVCDGPKGLDMYNQKHKEKSWRHRFEKNVKANENYLQYCKNPQSSNQVIKEIIVRPWLMVDLFQNVIKEDGFEIINLIFGEADYQIANLRRERGSWAVLTNDSDFFIFHDCLTIQIGFFDMDRDLGMGRSWSENKNGTYCNVNPDRLIVGMVNDNMLMKTLKLESHAQLCDYSVLMGNDYTIDFAAALRDYCEIKWKYDSSDIPDSRKVAEWVRQQSSPLISNETFLRFSASNSDYVKSVQFCIEFYNQSVPEPVLSFSSMENHTLWNYLERQYKDVKINNGFLLAYHGIAYQRNCVEPMAPTDIHTLLNDLRSAIYSLCIQYGSTTVTEYQVPNVPNNIRQLPVKESNLKINNFIPSPVNFFDTTWSIIDFPNCQNLPDAKKDGKTLNYFDRFGTNVGFCCYCLRTLWNFVNQKKYKESALVMTEPEFRAVFCAVFFRMLGDRAKVSVKHDQLYKSLREQFPNSWFFLLKVCQSSVCETTQEWLQVIYNLAYNYYGKGLKITKHFPMVSYFISGTVLSAFFEYVHNRGQRLRHLESSKINDIYIIMDIIFREFKGVYEAIVHCSD